MRKYGDRQVEAGFKHLLADGKKEHSVFQVVIRRDVASRIY